MATISSSSIYYPIRHVFGVSKAKHDTECSAMKEAFAKLDDAAAAAGAANGAATPAALGTAIDDENKGEVKVKTEYMKELKEIKERIANAMRIADDLLASDDFIIKDENEDKEKDECAVVDEKDDASSYDGSRDEYLHDFDYDDDASCWPAPLRPMRPRPAAADEYKALASTSPYDDESGHHQTTRGSSDTIADRRGRAGLRIKAPAPAAVDACMAAFEAKYGRSLTIRKPAAAALPKSRQHHERRAQRQQAASAATTALAATATGEESVREALKRMDRAMLSIQDSVARWEAEMMLEGADEDEGAEHVFASGVHAPPSPSLASSSPASNE
ncbi:hypothetical protein PG994_005103 [Apiospora phragmitis]|uniref:Uncharacterized protein n=1 Tax=Apiospora phragmitis TaxID=2905665 RepID=A0ABR1VSG8_9PEZI